MGFLQCGLKFLSAVSQEVEYHEQYQWKRKGYLLENHVRRTKVVTFRDHTDNDVEGLETE